MIKRSETIRETLLKEAGQRIAPSERVYDFTLTKAERSTVRNLLKEAESRLQKMRVASLEKEGMAAQSGVKDIRNSTANTVFGQPITSEDPDSVENKLYEAFGKWFYTTSQNKHLPVEGGVFIPTTPGSDEFGKVPQSHLRIEFPFHRTILPTKGEFANNANSSIGTFEQVIPHLGNFIADLEQNNIPVNPFFHSTVRSRQMGGINSREAIDFILPQVGKPVKMPDGQALPTSRSFYQEHADRLSSGGKVQLTVQQNHDRRYDRQHAKDLNVPAYLLKAIGSKIEQGYGVDWKALKADLRQEMNKLIQLNDYQHAHSKTKQLSDEQRQEIAQKKEAYMVYYENVLKSLQEAFKKAIMPLTAREDPNEWTGIGGRFSKHKLRGLRVNSKGNKHVAPVGVASIYLKLALFHMTKRVLPGSSEVGPGEFTVPGNKMTYYCNGMDSIPTDPSGNMVVFPSMRKVSGNVTYDTDQCNLGWVHLVHNGRSVEQMLQKWGAWCNGALNVLISLRQKLSDNVSDDVWKTVVFNRTNAETVIDILEQYPDYNSFRTGFLSQSMASKFTGGRSREQVGTLQESAISENGYRLLRQYGYQFAKMMDVVSGIAHRSTEDIIANRMDSGETVEEKFYGRNLATSTGKAERSTIMIGIRYANAAPRLASHDPRLQALVDKHRGRGQIAPAGQGEYVRRTQFPERGQELPEQYQTSSVYRVIHDLRFFVGLATSKANFQKPIGTDDYETWDQALNALLIHYPQIGNEVGAIIEPMNVNLKTMSSRFKKALARVQKDLAAQQIPIEIVVDDEVYHTTEIIDTATAAAQDDITGQDQSFEQATSDNANLFPQVIPEVQQMPEEAAALPPQAQPPAYQNEPGPEDEIPAAMPKPLVGTDDGNYIGKRDPSQTSLVRHRPDPMSGKLQHASNSFVDKLAQAANKLDESGEVLLAAKIDFLLKKLIEESNAHKES